VAPIEGNDAKDGRLNQQRAAIILRVDGERRDVAAPSTDGLAGDAEDVGRIIRRQTIERTNTLPAIRLSGRRDDRPLSSAAGFDHPPQQIDVDQPGAPDAAGQRQTMVAAQRSDGPGRDAGIERGLCDGGIGHWGRLGGGLRNGEP
jgi:hypothetical protein